MQKHIITISLLFFLHVGLYAQPKAVSEPRVIAKTDEPLQRPVWSADGEKLSLNYGQWEVSAKGNNLRRLPETGKGSGIRRNTADNAVLQQMTDDPRGVAAKVKGLESLGGYIIFNPVLSPQGDKIVFEASRGKGTFVCNADGSGLRSLGKKAECATWTPDGKYIVVMYVEDDGHVLEKGELHVIEVATGVRSVILATDKYIALNPALSPDGTKLAFEDCREGTIYVMDIQ